MFDNPMPLTLPTMRCGSTYDPDAIIIVDQETGLPRDITGWTVSMTIHDGINTISTLTENNGLVIVYEVGAISIDISYDDTLDYSAGEYSFTLDIIEDNGRKYVYGEGKLNVIGIPGASIPIIRVPIDVSYAINNSTAKTTPVNGDYFSIVDSAASWVLKKVSWQSIKTTLKDYFDTLYASVSGSLPVGGATRQVLGKINGTDYAVDWLELSWNDIQTTSEHNFVSDNQIANFSAHLGAGNSAHMLADSWNDGFMSNDYFNAFSSIASIPTSSFVGRKTAGTGYPETLSADDVRYTLAADTSRMVNVRLGWTFGSAEGADSDGAEDDTTILQAAFAYAKANNLNIYFPPGIYKITDYLSLDYTDESAASYTIEQPRPSIIGAGGRLSRIYVAATNAGIYIRGAYPSDYNHQNGLHWNGKISGIFFERDYQDYTGYNLYLRDLAQFVVEDVNSYGGNAGIYMEQCQKMIFRNVWAAYGNYGLYAIGDGGTNNTCNNSHVFIGCVFAGNNVGGMYLQNPYACFMVSGVVEQNGSGTGQASTVYTYGVKLEVTETTWIGSTMIAFIGVDFEGNGRSGGGSYSVADVWYTCVSGAPSNSFSVEGCGFGRYGNFVTYPIFMQLGSNTNRHGLSVHGSTFRGISGYTASSARKNILIDHPENVNISTGGNVYYVTGDGNETPDFSVSASLASGWTNYSGYTTKYTKLDGTVYVYGVVNGTATSSTIFTLPAGYRPISDMIVLILYDTGPSSLFIYADGRVVSSGQAHNTAYICGISFLAAE